MRPVILTAAAIAALALSACDKPASAPAPASAPTTLADPSAAGPQALSTGLAKRPETPAVYLDHIGPVDDVMRAPSVKVPASTPLTFDGFGVDGVAKELAKGVDIVIDGVAYPTTYGHRRKDVGAYFKKPELSASGFRKTLPAGTVAPGEHVVTVRIVAADGQGYFESGPVKFEVR